MRILCIAAYRSNHADRHVELLARSGFDVHLVIMEPHVPALEPLSAGVTVYDRVALAPPVIGRASPVPEDPLEARLLHLANRAVSSKNADTAATWIAGLIDRLRPDILHSFAIHQASFLTLLARAQATHKPFWVVSNWGCDIHHFGQDPRLKDEYLPAIRATLENADGYFAETQRDVALAHEAGFKGKVLAVQPIGGGFDLQWFRALRGGQSPSARKIIMVKGYEGNDTGFSVGRASSALKALNMVIPYLDGYEVNFYAIHDPRILKAAHRLRDKCGVTVRIHQFLPYEELMQLHGRARCSVGISETDGIATSAIEAMLMGSVPIQSDSSCLGEWIEPGAALIVPHDKPGAIADALIRALTDDAFVDAAAKSNDLSLKARFSMSAVDPVIAQMYKDAQSPDRGGLLDRTWRDAYRTVRSALGDRRRADSLPLG